MNKVQRYSRSMINSLIRILISLITFYLGILILKAVNWSFIISFSYIPDGKSFLLQIYKMITDISFYHNILISVYRVFMGFSIAVLVSIPLAIIVTEFAVANYIVVPLIELFRPIPNAAWVPLSILIFTTTNNSVLFITFVGAFFPILINTTEGLKNVNANYIRIAKSFNVSKIRMICEVKLPAAAPNIYTGILLGMSGSWLGVVVAEMMNGESGLGYLTWVSYTVCNISEVMVCMLFIGFLGAASGLLLKTLYNKLHLGEKNGSTS
ncbi:ABC transporter permease [Pseudobutyrivibrio sp.]|uniref:ABC transporter permease n=1 Tax=Pseudobutyrivibrio sp. TaxID=2014367 RepID=UPI0025DF04AE|nr:ABC transporter permease [Pseudobutyrivibrio sp.]